MIPGKHKGQIALANGLMHLRIAQMNFYSFALDNPDSRGGRIFTGYNGRIDWMLNDMVTNPRLPQSVREGIKSDIQSDVLVVPSIAQKVTLLTEENRLAIEALIDSMIAGEKLIVEKVNNEYVQPDM